VDRLDGVTNGTPMATKCTSEFEDAGFAEALDRHGRLDRLVDVRTASDFEVQPAGETADYLQGLYPGYAISTENAYRVSSRIAHTLARRGG
jgi:purine nucleoside permease